MKAEFLSLILFLGFSMGAQADEWPYDPICRNHNAISETVKLSQPRERTLVLCKFGMASYIEKNTLDKSATSLLQTWAVMEYKNNQADPFETKSCSELGAMIYPATDSKGLTYHLCIFGDDSVMEEKTFGYGAGDIWNQEMDQALGL